MSDPKRRRAPRIPWPILIVMSAGFWGITALLVWWGAAIAVRCERVDAGRVDVIAERHLLALVPMGTERLPDVVKAGTIRRRGQRSGSSTRVGPQLTLKLRDGREWESMPTATHIVGTRPAEMAARIQEFIDRPEAPPVTLGWIPWLMTGLAVPFLLICGLFAAVWVNIIRRALGWGGPA